MKVTMPELGESVVEGTVGKWLISEGQHVHKDQPLVEITTDKADSEVPSPVAGVVKRLLAAQDETISVGEALCEIDESAESQAGSAPETPRQNEAVKRPQEAARTEAPVSGNGTSSAQAVRKAAASPAVRKLARERGVDLNAVSPTGDPGRLTREDVLLAEGAAPSSMQAPQVPAGRARAFQVPPYREKPGDKVVPFTRRRRIIAEHMLYSKQTSPDVVTLAECDLHRASRLRDEHKGALKKDGVNLSFLTLVASATCRALREFPTLNSRVLEDAYVLLHEINLGIAVDTPEGLVVPVIRHADELTVRGIARAIDEVAERARKGDLRPDDLANKTFTISNPGRQGNLVGGAIISQPNVGILRMGTIKKRAVVVEHDSEDLIAIHPVMHMALTYDHRVIDGVAANGFLHRVVEILEAAEFEI